MGKYFSLLIAFIILSFADARAVPPANKFDFTQNAILIYEAIGQMDCPVYLQDSYTGTITYEWY